MKQKLLDMDWIQNLLSNSRASASPEMQGKPLEERVNTLQSQNTELRGVVEGLLGVLGKYNISLSSSTPSEPVVPASNESRTSESPEKKEIGLGLLSTSSTLMNYSGSQTGGESFKKE
jgi:hypothetical protein